MPKRRCICRGCPACGTGHAILFDREDTGTWRCTPCQAVVDQRARARLARLKRKPKASSAARGYGPVYRRRRDELVAQALATCAPCVLCGLVISKLGEPINSAHHPNGHPARADQNTCLLQPAHKSCNERAGKP